jgi:hypothetical protein
MRLFQLLRSKYSRVRKLFERLVHDANLFQIILMLAFIFECSSISCTIRLRSGQLLLYAL